MYLINALHQIIDLKVHTVEVKDTRYKVGPFYDHLFVLQCNIFLHKSL